MQNKTRWGIVLICFLGFQGAILSAYGGEDVRKTKVDPRDNYLSLEALCGYEGMPYEFLIPRDQYVKSKNDPKDIYLDMESLCGEDPPFKYVVIPSKHVKTKVDPMDRKLGPEEMMSEDPSVLGIKE
ncbi:MAG: hypothetical protein KQH63_16155 [Desulfobulbaceae bacterium]|nr:hypothetical protein [Desulfobulbaceae bacterium]